MSNNASLELVDSIILWTLLMTAMDESRLQMLNLDKAMKYFRKLEAFLQLLKQN